MDSGRFFFMALGARPDAGQGPMAPGFGSAFAPSMDRLGGGAGMSPQGADGFMPSQMTGGPMQQLFTMMATMLGALLGGMLGMGDQAGIAPNSGGFNPFANSNAFEPFGNNGGFNNPGYNNPGYNNPGFNNPGFNNPGHNNGSNGFQPAWHPPTPNTNPTPFLPANQQVTNTVGNMGPSRAPSWFPSAQGYNSAYTRTCDIGGLEKPKQQMVGALDQVGASPEEKSLVMAMGLTETTHLTNAEGDKSKSGSSTNYGPFNINCDMAQTLAGSLGLKNFNPSDLDGPNGLATSAQLLTGGIRKFGSDWVMAFHRGGSSAFEGGKPLQANGQGGTPRLNDWRVKSYVEPVRAQAAAIRNNPQMLTNNQKFNYSIPWI